MKKLNFLLFSAFTSLTSSAYAEVKSFTPHFPKFYSSAATRKADNQFYALGEAKFFKWRYNTVLWRYCAKPNRKWFT